MSNIADENEVLEMYTSIMRREIPDYVKDGHEILDVPVKPSDMMKAGEALLKRFDGAERPVENGEGTKYGVVILPPVAPA